MCAKFGPARELECVEATGRGPLVPEERAPERKAVPPQSREEAVRNTLQAKLSVARSRAQHSATKAQREAEAQKAGEYARKLESLGTAD